ncbi:MAG: hypothetical protein II711_00925 [Clostridia bacterium]|nr:hypothetical protein [Clostridia bacterium]
MSKNFTLRYSGYNSNLGLHDYQLGSKSLSIRDDNGDKPTAITITSGSGTALDPYTFTVVH